MAGCPIVVELPTDDSGIDLANAGAAINLKGTVTKVEWMNPHTYFYIDVAESNGQTVNWGLEMGSPNGLMRAGWTRNTLKVGDVVTVEGSRAKDGFGPKVFTEENLRRVDALGDYANRHQDKHGEVIAIPLHRAPQRRIDGRSRYG